LVDDSLVLQKLKCACLGLAIRGRLEWDLAEIQLFKLMDQRRISMGNFGLGFLVFLVVACGDSKSNVAPKQGRTSDATPGQTATNKPAAQVEGARPEPAAPAPAAPAPAKADYASVKAAILDPSCIGCHSAAGRNRGGINLETYENVKKGLDAVVAEINSNSMPPSAPLSAELKLRLKEWVDAGAPQ